MSGQNAEPPPLLGVGDPVPRAKWVWLAPVLIAVVLASAIGAFFVADRMQSSVAGPERVADLFLRAVADDDLRLSYGLLCERRRAITNTLEFRDEALDGQAAARAAVERGRRSVSGEGDSRRVSYVVPTGRRTDRVDVRLVREPERWAVCSFDPDAG